MKWLPLLRLKSVKLQYLSVEAQPIQFQSAVQAKRHFKERNRNTGLAVLSVVRHIERVQKVKRQQSSISWSRKETRLNKEQWAMTTFYGRITAISLFLLIQKKKKTYVSVKANHIWFSSVCLSSLRSKERQVQFYSYYIAICKYSLS